MAPVSIFSSPAVVAFERVLARVEPYLFVFCIAAILTAGYETFSRLVVSFRLTSEVADIGPVLILDLVLILLLTGLLGRRFILSLGSMSIARSGRRLLLRMVVIFILIALVPVAAVTAVSIRIVNFNLQSLFAKPVSTAIKESSSIAETYLEERRLTVLNNASAMANRLNQDGALLSLDLERLQTVMDQEALQKGLTEVLLIELVPGRREIEALLKAGTTEFDDQRSVEFSSLDLERAINGEIVFKAGESLTERVSVFMKPDQSLPYFMFIAQAVPPDVLQRVNLTRQAASRYKQLETVAGRMQRNALIVFAVIAFSLMLVAAFVGLFFAASISAPVSWLIHASQRVGAGRLELEDVPVTSSHEKDEFSRLIRSFTLMTQQLKEQRMALLGANEQLDERRRFTEAVLSGVSSGVVGLDAGKAILLANASANHLLGISLEHQQGMLLSRVVPELRDFLSQELTHEESLVTEELSLVNKQLKNLKLKVTMVAEWIDDAVSGYVVTFDDVTDLVDAQKSAAWSDVARRVAHEIKNPLTPIQLSAERLKRRYRKQLTDGTETFDLCTDTIIRQVGDIRQMVDEFSSFARSNDPKMERVEVCTLLRQAIFLEQQISQQVKFDLQLDEKQIFARLDPRLLNQAILNLLRNATEAIGGMETPPETPRISLSARIDSNDKLLCFIVSDNGPGLPEDKVDQLTDPYVTFKASGTGLGLSIVKKIVQDHGGFVRLENKVDEMGQIQGAIVSLAFPMNLATRTLARSEATVSDDTPETEFGEIITQGPQENENGV